MLRLIFHGIHIFPVERGEALTIRVERFSTDQGEQNTVGLCMVFPDARVWANICSF